MKKSIGITVEKPVSFWLKEIKVDFKDLFKALGKVVIGFKIGNPPMSAAGFIESISSFSFKKNASQAAWILIYRSLARAMYMLVEENRILLREATRGFQSLANKTTLDEEDLDKIAFILEYAVDARCLSIDQSFFDHPRDFPVLEDLKKPFSEWLEKLGLNSSQSATMSDRLPSYFVFGLNEEWKANREEYSIITEEIPTPFTKAAKREQEWEYYNSYLQKKVDESLFGEPFGLRQIYIPLRAFYESKGVPKANRNSHYDDIIIFTDGSVRIVVDLEVELQHWIESNDKNDTIRVLSGGPGYGKSSIAKMFASKQSEKRVWRVLFIPLHLFDPGADLADALDEFIKQEGYFSSGNFLDPTEGERKLLLIFDGLDELTMQGKVGNEVAQQFVGEVQRKIDRYNSREIRLKVLICGRDIAVQKSADSLHRNTKILQLLPFRVRGPIGIYYFDNDKLLNRDQRNDWWARYGKVSGYNFEKLPENLNYPWMVEITSLPLLNYLVALSYTRKRINFDNNTNLNEIYQDLLDSVYEREGVWADNRHVALDQISKSDFIRIFEEIALSAWHGGDARTVTVKEIESQCERNGLKPLLEKFQERAKDGVSSLLVAFYFKKSGIQENTLNETFEFTHKSFGEFLTAKRIVRGVNLICDQIRLRQSSYEKGWDSIQALVYWVQLCGKNTIDFDLLNFIIGEIAIEYKNNESKVSENQKILNDLFIQVLELDVPMEKLADNRPGFKEEKRQALNAEESLLAILHSHAVSTTHGIISNIQNLSLLYKWVTSEHQSQIFKGIIEYISLPNAILRRANLEGVNLKGANLEGVNLKGANLERANLKGANLERANLEGANLEGANLERAYLARAYLWSANLNRVNLEKANLVVANLNRANLEKANLVVANLSGANLEGANLRDAKVLDVNLEGVNLMRANLAEAILERTNLERANLTGANLAVANLERANLSGTNLARAYLRSANLVEANLKGANLEGVNLKGANLERANLKGANLERANLEGANLERAYLEGANLERANLEGAILKKTYLFGAKLNDEVIINPDTDMQELTKLGAIIQ